MTTKLVLTVFMALLPYFTCSECENKCTDGTCMDGHYAPICPGHLESCEDYGASQVCDSEWLEYCENGDLRCLDINYLSICVPSSPWCDGVDECGLGDDESDTLCDW